MEFKKCERCGCFFTSPGDTCVNCSPKDKLEINKLKNFLNGVSSVGETNLDSLSYLTGITTRNLNRYLGSDEFAGVAQKIGLSKIETNPNNNENGNVNV